MDKINIISLVPLIVNAAERHGEEVAALATASAARGVAYEAESHARMAYVHVHDDPRNEENEFAAELFEEAALMFLAAAKMLRDGVKK